MTGVDCTKRMPCPGPLTIPRRLSRCRWTVENICVALQGMLRHTQNLVPDATMYTDERDKVERQRPEKQRAAARMGSPHRGSYAVILQDSICFAYASAESSASNSPASLISTTIIQASSYGDSLTFSGASASALFTSITWPLTGA